MRDAVDSVVDVELEPPPLRAGDEEPVVVVVLVVVVEGRWLKHRADGKVPVDGGVRERDALALVGSEEAAEEGAREDMELRKRFMMLGERNGWKFCLSDVEKVLSVRAVSSDGIRLCGGGRRCDRSQTASSPAGQRANLGELSVGASRKKDTRHAVPTDNADATETQMVCRIGSRKLYLHVQAGRTDRQKSSTKSKSGETSKQG